MTHIAQIKTHLEAGRTINPIEALQVYGCFRLAARIKDLKDSGYPIEKTMIEVENRRGDLVRVASYRKGQPG